MPERTAGIGRRPPTPALAGPGRSPARTSRPPPKRDAPRGCARAPGVGGAATRRFRGRDRPPKPTAKPRDLRSGRLRYRPVPGIPRRSGPGSRSDPSPRLGASAPPAGRYPDGRCAPPAAPQRRRPRGRPTRPAGALGAALLGRVDGRGARSDGRKGGETWSAIVRWDAEGALRPSGAGRKDHTVDCVDAAVRCRHVRGHDGHVVDRDARADHPFGADPERGAPHRRDRRLRAPLRGGEGVGGAEPLRDHAVGEDGLPLREVLEERGDRSRREPAQRFVGGRKHGERPRPLEGLPKPAAVTAVTSVRKLPGLPADSI